MNNKLPSSTNYLPISEAAKFLGVSLDTLRRWDKSGILNSKRLDGKNRYFALEDLKKNISNRPLSISEVSKKFNISSTTLRRLEARGVIKPLRNKAGVRVFDSAIIESFVKSQYFQHKKHTLKKPKTLPKRVKALTKSQSIKQAPIKELDTVRAAHLAPRSNLSHFLAVSTATFVLLVVVGLGNVFLFKTQNYEMLPLTMVLGEKINAPLEVPTSQIIEPKETSSTSKQEVKVQTPATPLEKYIADSLNMINEKKQKRASQSDLLRLVEIAATDSASIDIKKQPDNVSPVVGSARGGEVFQFKSFNSGWIELQLHESTESGFIEEKNALVKEFEFSVPEFNGWTNLNESTSSSSITGPTEATAEGKNDQSAN